MREPAKTFQDLVVWQKSHQFVLAVYRLTHEFPRTERYGLTSQLRRAAVSIPANIAEGFKRRGKADKVRFLAEKVRLLRFGTLRQRIAGHLLALAGQQKTDNPVWRYSREQTADLLGVARPSLSRELSLMVQGGFIEAMDRSNVRIISASLKQLLEEK